MVLRRIFVRLSVFAGLALALAGCAATDKQLSRDALKPINSIAVARIKSPPFLKETTASATAGATGAMFGAIGGAIGGVMQQKMMESDGKQLQEKFKLPDYGTGYLPS